jgi:rubrerythrin
MAKSLAGTKSHENLKGAFAGESQANRRYLYFARVADIEGYPDVGGLFRDTSEAETGHAFGHLDFLKEVGDPCTGVAIGTTAKNLKSAVEGETYEYTEMYPKFRHLAVEEGNMAAVTEFDEQIEESKVHAAAFRRTLEMAAKRFAALAKVEERHANHYRAALAAVKA